ncbi:MAG TPA: hypothetical protein VF544_06875 [Pyrinomonadaceae bacterium]|jgi:hypothetical protein
MRKPTTVKNPIVTTTGLAEIGLKLRPAYPNRSWQEVVLTNEGTHHIIAAVIHYELTSEDGRKQVAREIICDPNISLETSPTKIKELLARYPVIPPHSNWLAGVGIDRVRLSNRVPPFEETRHLMAQKISFDFLSSVNITIDGVILEDGQMIGPQLDEPKQWITKVINGFKGRDNEK